MKPPTGVNNYCRHFVEKLRFHQFVIEKMFIHPQNKVNQQYQVEMRAFYFIV